MISRAIALQPNVGVYYINLAGDERNVEMSAQKILATGNLELGLDEGTTWTDVTNPTPDVSLHPSCQDTPQAVYRFTDVVGVSEVLRGGIVSYLRQHSYGSTETTDLWDALERARLADLIASLPDGLETVVGERGYRLSGGERQRLTIARLLLKQPRVVILDEATASLDSTSEAAVQEALAAALAGRTALVIAHRLSTVRAADLILVVEDGQIIERGTHDALRAAAVRATATMATALLRFPAPGSSYVSQAGDLLRIHRQGTQGYADAFARIITDVQNPPLSPSDRLSLDLAARTALRTGLAGPQSIYPTALVQGLGATASEMTEAASDAAFAVDAASSASSSIR